MLLSSNYKYSTIYQTNEKKIKKKEKKNGAMEKRREKIKKEKKKNSGRQKERERAQRPAKNTKRIRSTSFNCIFLFFNFNKPRLSLEILDLDMISF